MIRSEVDESGAGQPFSTTVRVFYEDTDVTGVVYHANYLKYMERARTLWMEAQGVTHRELAAEHGLVFTLIDAKISFRAPARLDDTLVVTAAAAERRRVRVVFAQAVRCEGRTLVEAQFTVACVRLGDFKPSALPTVLYKENR